MEDIQLITYIIFAVLYLIFKLMQKKKDPGQEQGGEVQQQRKPQKPAMTFEEMLRDFTGEPYEQETVVEERPQQKPAEHKKEVSEPKKYFSYEDEYDQQAQKTYQESIERGEKALTLDEQINLDTIKVEKIQVIEDDEHKKTAPSKEYLDAFNSLDGAKKAFVYSEIFNRKYT